MTPFFKAKFDSMERNLSASKLRMQQQPRHIDTKRLALVTPL